MHLLVSWLVEVKGKAKITKENDLSQVQLHAAVQVHPDTFETAALDSTAVKEHNSC